jgi:hypothetical protein
MLGTLDREMLQAYRLWVYAEPNRAWPPALGITLPVVLASESGSDYIPPSVLREP